jgi:CRISPR-associated protein (TIGR03986 family)
MKKEYTLKSQDNNYWIFSWINEKGENKSFKLKWDNLPKDLDGKTVIALELNQSNNMPSKIEFEGKQYNRLTPAAPPPTPNAQNKGRNGGRNQGGNAGRNQGPYNNTRIQAPYNFISLNETVVPSKNHGNNFHTFEGHSGYIDLEFENLTNIFIKGKDIDFFKAGKKYAIPGSSLRGMLRQLIEIVSWGKMTIYTDYKMSERDKDNYNNDNQMGFLYYDRKNDNFQIRPVTNYPENIIKPDQIRNFTYKMDPQDQEYVYVITKTVGASRHFRVRYKCQNHHFTLDKNSEPVKNYIKDETRNAEGEMANVIETAMKSNNALMNEFGNSYIGIPIWYKAIGDKIISFGHCKNYRVPFKKSIKDGIHQNGDVKNIIDFAESMFGSADKDKQSAGKLYVQDLMASEAKIEEAILQILSNPYPKNKDLYLVPGTSWDKNPKIRGYKQYWHRNTAYYNDPVTVEAGQYTPQIDQVNFNKTKFRKNEEYLKFKPGNDTNFKVANLRKAGGQNQEFTFTKTLKATNNSAINNEIRPKITNEANKLQFKIANTIQPGAKFKGRIRFVNLSDEELGTILFILNLPDNCCYKIGTGKSIGLGSMKLNNATLTLIDRKERYMALLSEDGKWALAEEEMGSVKNYILSFENHMNKEIGHKGILWEHSRMKELKAMLTYRDDVASDAWLKRTNYMSLEGFREAKQPLNDPITIVTTH